LHASFEVCRKEDHVPGVRRVTDQTDIKGINPAETNKQLIKLLLELGPLVVFFFVNTQFGIYWGTGCFVVATIIALTAGCRSCRWYLVLSSSCSAG
jgi:hypothetical protein